jgi:hypothetical protein
MQNRTMKAAVTVCDDWRFISAGGEEPVAGWLTQFDAVPVPDVRMCPINLWSAVSQGLKKKRLLTNEGMLMILCPEVEELLAAICTNLLNGPLQPAKRGEIHVHDTT